MNKIRIFRLQHSEFSETTPDKQLRYGTILIFFLKDLIGRYFYLGRDQEECLG